MKRLLLLITLVISLVIVATAQSGQRKVVFEYDASGNRIIRYIDTLPPSPPSPAPPVPPASDSTVTNPADTTMTFTVAVYPNPVQTDLTITIEPVVGAPALPPVFEVRIVGSMGTIHYLQTHTYTAPLNINMSAYGVGLYKLFITRGTEIQQINLLKQ
jgi:hypothetical protein